MPTACEFTLNRQKIIYFAGDDTIEGSVYVNNSHSKEVESVNVHFRGFSKCGYVMLQRYIECAPECMIRKIQFTSNEVIVEDVDCLQEGGTLQTGRHTWNIRFPVPGHCPTSLECKYGQIRYELCLEIINSGTKYKNIFIKPITVIKKYELNLYPWFKEEHAHKVTSLTCCGLQRGLLYYHLKTPVAAFSPGQMLRYSFKVCNKLQEEIHWYQVKFKREIICKLDQPFSCKKKLTTTFKTQHVADNGLNDQLYEGQIFIPSTPPSMETKYISVKYYLKMIAKHSSYLSNVKAKLYIEIGTSPLRKTLTQQQLDQNFINSPTFELVRRDTATFIDYSTADMNRVDDFLPFYPMFRNTEPDVSESIL